MRKRTVTNTVWRGGKNNNDWTTGGNWSDGAPVAGDEAYFTGPATVLVNNTLLDGVVLNAMSTPTATVNMLWHNSTMGAGSTFYTGGYGGPIGVTMTDSVTNAGTIYAWQNVLNIALNPKGGLTNTGWMVAAGNETTPTIAVTATYDGSGGFNNRGGVYALNGGTVSFNFGGRSANSTAIYNSNLIDAQAGGNVMFAARGTGVNRVSYGTLSNSNTLLAENGGKMTVQADLMQSDNAVIEARDGGTVRSEGSISGGYVKIDSHMLGTPSHLSFGMFDQYSGASYAAQRFNSGLVLQGQAEINFPAAISSFDFNEGSNTLTVFERYGQDAAQQVAALHLVGSYTKSEFSIVAGGLGVAFDDHTAVS